MKFIKKYIVVVSISINIIFLVLGCYFILKKGGIDYLISKIIVSNIETKKENIQLHNPYYLNRISLFSILPQSNNSIVFLGDSITDGCEWSELFINSNIKNRGIGSDTTYSLLNRIQEIVNLKPKKVFLMIGINDLGLGRSVAETIADYDKILAVLTESLPNSEIYLQSVLPINNRKFTCNPNLKDNKEIISLNNQIRKLAKRYALTYIDLYSKMNLGEQLNPKITEDGVHLNGAGYEIWKNVIQKYVKN